ncbi:hypothetical protein [Pseudomonas abietaniphila]|uniref:Uncharacterized protein n=1 Tax=Pseudomonas abietaniphila TaxID=89065 RepID=A0A1G8AME2_9PSED|nr:hypothetical protein [Pseudomonas abietaniphila]SDH22077.1 hypothetical protein SAMN05216605_105102 [Pseudomonas abietaniphila]
MNLTSIGNQNRLVAQAAEAVGGKGNIEATGHPITGQIEVAAPAPPYPDAVYHEVKLDGTLRPTGDGGVIFRTLSSWEFREQAKLDAYKHAAECRAADMENMRDEMKSRLADSEPELATKPFGFSIDETGLIKPVGLGCELTQREKNILSSLMNEDEAFRCAAQEYIKMLAGIVHRSLEGLGAKYARFFSPA